MIVGIIDYGMGNLLSVRNAFAACGVTARIVERGSELADVSAIALPGVGAFGRGMAGLRERGFLEALERDVMERKKPMLGICLGLQLLATLGTELGEHAGLGWVPGVVRRLEPRGDLPVPHIGWNDLTGQGRLFSGVPARTSFYFVHSYHLVPESAAVVTARTDYGGEFVAAVERENVFAVQFHPEKSHKFGLAVLKNFVAAAQRA